MDELPVSRVFMRAMFMRLELPLKCNFNARVLAAIGLVCLLCPPAALAENIHVVREVPVSQYPTSTYAVVRTPDGGYLLAGSTGVSDSHAWAARFDANGKRHWQLLDAPKEAWGDILPDISRFNGAVVLPNDKILLCGTRDITNAVPRKNVVGRIVLLNSNATHIEDGDREFRDMEPSGEGSSGYFFTEIQTCTRWGDGVALVATTHGSNEREPTASGWLVKLDLTGKVVWEKFLPFLNAFDAMETADHHLLVLSWVYEYQGLYARLDKIDEDGNIVFTRQVPGGDAGGFVRPLSSVSAISIITTDREGATRLLQVDSSLKDIGKPVSVGKFRYKQSYQLADGSIVLFGGISNRGATAAAARIKNSSWRAFLIEPEQHSSFSVTAATPADHPGEFATVRSTAEFHPVLAWISVEK